MTSLGTDVNVDKGYIYSCVTSYLKLKTIAVQHGGHCGYLESKNNYFVPKFYGLNKYGIPKKNPVNEQSETIPKEDYGRSKLEAEQVCYDPKYKDLDITIIRPRTIMGHGRLGIFEILFDCFFIKKS